MRREFSRRLKAAIIKRAMDERGRIRCECCGADATGKRVEIDHIIAEGLRTAEDRAKPLTAEEGQALCGHCHDAKTFGADIPRIARAKRQEARDLNLKPRPKMKARGFPPANPRRPATTPLEKQLPPRRLGQ